MPVEESICPAVPVEPLIDNVPEVVDVNWPYEEPFQEVFAGKVLVVQVIPSVEDAAVDEFFPVAVNIPLPNSKRQSALDGKVLAVQVIPSVEVAAVVELDVTATNILFPNFTLLQELFDGIVLAVQVIASVEVAAACVPHATATKVLFP